MPGPLTPASALTEVRTLVNDLARAVRDLGPLPATRDLTNDLTTLSAYCDGSGVDVDIAVAGFIAPDVADTIGRWLSPSIESSMFVGRNRPEAGELRVMLDDGSAVARIFPASRAPAVKVASPRPAVLVCISASAGGLAEAAQSLEELVEDRPLAIVVSAAVTAGAVPGELRGAWASESRPVSGLTGATLLSSLGGNAVPGLPSLLRASAALYGLETAGETLKIVIEQEQRAAKIKRAMTQQEAARLQQPPPNPGEQLSEMRGRLQRTLGEFERTSQERMRELTAPQIGTLTKRAEQRLTALTALSTTPGEKTMTLRLPAEDESGFLALIRDELRRRFVQDLTAFREVTDALGTEVGRALESANAMAVTLQHVRVADTRMSRILDSVVRIDRAYRGETPKYGVSEYFQQAKKYQMMVYMLVSTFGLAGVPALRAVMVPLSIGLLVIGMLSLPSAIKRERAEQKTRELEKARDSLRGEMRRMFGEAEREWAAVIAETARDEHALVLKQFETALREGQTRQAADASEERRRVQRLLQGIDNTDRQLAAARRARDLVGGTAAQVRAGLRQLIVARRTPTAPKPT